MRTYKIAALIIAVFVFSFVIQYGVAKLTHNEWTRLITVPLTWYVAYWLGVKARSWE